MTKSQAGVIKLVLASASPRRLALLQQLGVTPDALVAPDIDETVRSGERVSAYALRMAQEKAQAAARLTDLAPECLILAADTVVSVGRRILGKPEDEKAARQALSLLSGRSHRVMTAIALYGPKGAERTRLIETRVTMKRLSDSEQTAYLLSQEWQGKAGGYAIQGLAAAFVTRLVGSFTNVVGLPLAETTALLQGAGYPVVSAWQQRAGAATARVRLQ